MSNMSYDEIFSTFEEITNNYSRNDQYFDILYDSTSSTIIVKSPSSEDITVNTKTSGVKVSCNIFCEKVQNSNKI